MKTERGTIEAALRMFSAAMAAGMAVGILAMMLIAVLIENDLIQHAYIKFADGVILAISVLGGTLAIKQPQRRKRVICCIGSGCVCYFILLIVNGILNGNFSLGTIVYWMVVIIVGLCAGLCGKQQHVSLTTVRKYKTSRIGRF